MSIICGSNDILAKPTNDNGKIAKGSSSVMSTWTITTVTKAIFDGKEPPKINLMPPKISYFRLYKGLFLAGSDRKKAENKLLFSATRPKPPNIAYFRRLSVES